MASGGPGRPSEHAGETTAPPEGMYWVQMQGLWALRPIDDLDQNRERESGSQPTERPAGSVLEQQRVSLSDADRQWLSQSAGAACSAAALSEASAPPEGAGSSQPERLPRTQGVVEFHHQHCSPSFAAAVAQDTALRLLPQPFTQPQPVPLPAAAAPQDAPESFPQDWPDWFLRWGRRVEGDNGPDDAPGPSAPPSAPPSPPETPQQRLDSEWFYPFPLSRWGLFVVPLLAVVLSLIDMIRRTELSLTADHPTLLLHYAALGGVLTHCVLLATASKETIAAFLFVIGTSMQCMQLLLVCALSAADVAVTFEAHLLSMPAAICCYLVQGGSQGSYPFPEEARCGRSLATFLALQAVICQSLYLRTASLAALTIILPCSSGAFALAFGLARCASREPDAAQYRRVVHHGS